MINGLMQTLSENKKSRIRETSNILTFADSRTDTILERLHDLLKKKYICIKKLRGCVIFLNKKTPKKPDFFKKRKKIIENAKTQKRLEICQY